MQVLVQPDNLTEEPTLVHIQPVPDHFVPSCSHSNPTYQYMLYGGQNYLMDIRQTWQNNATRAKENDDPQFTYIRFNGDYTWYVFPKGFIPPNHSVIWR